MDEAAFPSSVSRLMELRELEQHIADEQRQIREETARHLEQRGTKGWSGQILGHSVKVTRQERVQVNYDEALLRQRLGDRFLRIASLDRKRLAERETEVLAWLGDRALEVVKVDRNKVKAALETGEVQTEAFRRAFERRVSYTVALQVGDRPTARRDEE